MSSGDHCDGSEIILNRQGWRFPSDDTAYTAVQMLTTECAASMVMVAYIVLMASLKLTSSQLRIGLEVCH